MVRGTARSFAAVLFVLAGMWSVGGLQMPNVSLTPSAGTFSVAPSTVTTPDSVTATGVSWKNNEQLRLRDVASILVSFNAVGGSFTQVLTLATAGIHHLILESFRKGSWVVVGSADVTVISGTTTTIPSGPQNLAAMAGNTQIALTWTTPTTDGGSAITVYKVYRGSALLVTLGVVLTYTDRGLANGTPYTYAVSALNANGEGPKSASASATPVGTSPVITNVVVSSITQNAATISWDVNAYSTAQVFYGTTTAYGLSTAKDTNFNFTHHSQVLSGLALNTVYHYRVQSCDNTGLCTYSPDGTFQTSSDHWAGIAFMSRPQSGPLTFSGGSDIEVSNKSFTGNIYPSSALRFVSCNNIWIHDNDFDQISWDAIDILGCTGTITIEWNRVGTLNYVSSGRRPDFVQMAVGSKMVGHIRNNKIKTGGQNEDIISTVDDSGGVSSTQMLEIDHNAIQGTANGAGYPSTSGTGTMMSDNSTTGGHIWTHHNTYLNPAQVGAAISMGVDDHFTDNIIYGAQATNSNVGFYTPYTGGAPNPGNHECARNRIWWKNAAGALNALFDGGASGTVSGLSPQTNTLDDTTIDWTQLVVTL